MPLSELFPVAVGVAILAAGWRIHQKRKQKKQSMEVHGMWTKRWKGTFR